MNRSHASYSGGFLVAVVIAAAALDPSSAGAEETAGADAAVAQTLRPSGARPEQPDARPELVAEALYLGDPLPPGSHDLTVAFAVQDGAPDPVTGETGLVMLPRVQLAMPLGDRLGFTADVGVRTSGGPLLEAPAASLKVLLRDPGAGRTGLAACLDLLGSTSLSGTAVGVGVGAIRSVGPFGVRASLGLTTGVASWTPALQGGLSAAIALAPRWRALAEVVTHVAGGDVAVAAGPTVKVVVAARTAVMAGALFPLSGRDATPVFTLQLTQSL